MRIVKLTQESKKTLLNDLLKRSPNNYGQYEKVVADIIADVRENGDSALFELAHKFDKNNITAAEFQGNRGRDQRHLFPDRAGICRGYEESRS